MAYSGERGIDTLQRNAEVDAKVRLLVLVWLPAADGGLQHAGRERGVGGAGEKWFVGGVAGLREASVGDGSAGALAGIALQVGVDSVRMLRNLVAGQRHGVRTEALGQAARRQARPVALLAACAAREVGQLEGRLPIAAVERADQREQRRVLRDRQRSAVDLRGKYVQRDFDAVVLAMPFSVLRDVEMRGVEMSAWKRQAIDKSEMGDSSRLLVGFSRPYWREAGASGSGSGKADLPNLQNAWETNPSRAGRAGAVIAHQVGGQAARSLLPASLQMDAVGFVASLEEVLPGAMQAVSRDRRGRILATSQNWSTDPNSRGAFPRPQPGYFTRIAQAEAGAVDNLLFAGDHTSSFYEWQGFMEGAVLSGLRAAGEASTLFRGG